MSTPDLPPEKEEIIPILDPDADKKSKLNFSVFCAAVFFLNFDTGLFPLAVKLIMKEININHAQVAFMGSSVNAGLSFGSLLVPFCYRIFEARTFLIFCLLVHMIAISTFASISHYSSMVALRFISGIAAGGHLIYVPVYINNFGPKILRARWIGLVNLANPIGTTFGIIISLIFIVTVKGIFKWRLPVIFQMTFEAILVYLFYRMKNSEIDVNAKTEADTSVLVSRDVRSFFKDLVRVVKCPMVLVGTACYCFFFFSLAGIQFWSVFYMERIYGTDPEQSVLIYLTISVLACILGVYFGGHIVDKAVKILIIQGGYDRDNWTRCSYILIFFALNSLLFGILSCIHISLLFFIITTFICVTMALAVSPGSAGMVLTSMEPFNYT